LEQGRSLARGQQDDRRLGVLADRCDVVHRQRRAACGVQHSLEVPSGQRAGSGSHLVRVAHELELRVTPEGVTQLGQAFAVPGDEDSRLLSGLWCLAGRHREIPPKARRHCLALAPSLVLVGELLISSWLSDGSVIGRSSTDQSPLLTTHQNFVAWESVIASMTLNPSFGLAPRWLV